MLIKTTHFPGLQDYPSTLSRMQAYTQSRNKKSEDQIWLMEHFPTFTSGISSNSAKLPSSIKGIKLYQTDRGGKLSYHGPGQLMIYTMFDLKRLKLRITSLVNLLEETIIILLNKYGINGHRIKYAPGVYINNEKIASIGLKISNGYCYHGASLNVNVSKNAFNSILPCGYSGLSVVNLLDFICVDNNNEITDNLTPILIRLISEHK